MSKPFRDTSSGVGLDVVVTLPADVCEKIKQAAKERGETFDGWRRAELVAAVEVECTAEVPPEELAFDVRQALAKAPATKRLDDLAVQTLAERYAVLPAPGEEGLPRGWLGLWSCAVAPASSRRPRVALPCCRMASAIGPNRDGPENTSSSTNLRSSPGSRSARNLKTLGMAPARDFEAGASMPYISQKCRMSAQAGRNDFSSNRAARASIAVRRSGEISILPTYSGVVVLGLCRPFSRVARSGSRFPSASRWTETAISSTSRLTLSIP